MVGQVTPKLSMFWTAAMLMKTMYYKGIWEIKFWTAGPGIGDAVVAYWDVPCIHVFVASVLPACGVHHLLLHEVVPCIRVCGPPTFKTPSSTFFPNELQLLCHLQFSRLFRLPPHFGVLSALLHMWASEMRFLVLEKKSQWLSYSSKDIMEKYVQNSFTNNFF